MLVGLSGGTTSVVPSRSFGEPEVSRPKESATRRRITVIVRRTTDFGCDTEGRLPTIVWNVPPLERQSLGWPDGARLLPGEWSSAAGGGDS
jgi:hypothetical protein